VDKPAEEKIRILIVDDDPDLVDLLKLDLSGKGYETATASNGKEALTQANSKKFDLVLLDVMMPYVDGYHVAHEISSKLGVNAPKVLLMTSRDTVRERGVILMSGADAAIQKPFALNELHTKIEEVLKAPKEK
jgi:DNA-binding response OmpR family regulator